MGTPFGRIYIQINFSYRVFVDRRERETTGLGRRVVLWLRWVYVTRRLTRFLGSRDLRILALFLSRSLSSCLSTCHPSSLPILGKLFFSACFLQAISFLSFISTILPTSPCTMLHGVHAIVHLFHPWNLYSSLELRDSEIRFVYRKAFFFTPQSIYDPRLTASSISFSSSHSL